MTRRTFFAHLALLILALSAAWPAHEATAITTIRVAQGLNRPIYVTAPAGDDRLFIVEQRGVIKILQNGNVLATPFLDIDALIPDISGNDERGLLGLAFHPQYASNGYFYVNYTNLFSDTVIKRYHVSADPNVADPADTMTVLVVDQPFNNHNGGHLAFGPFDCYLYIGMGDGGSGGDPFGNGQNTGVLLGKMLRIDVDGGTPYAIPPDNPFAGPGPPLDEIWTIGMRNPYRWSFDRLNGDLYIADVGQNCWEEVDYQPASSNGGENYGWNIMEGNHCYDGVSCNPQGCNMTGLTLPIHEFSHGGTPFRCSITGGYVYRGNSIPAIQGVYFFADFCSNQIWSFRVVNNQVTEFTDRTTELAPGGGLAIGTIAGFGEDGFGELYIVDRDATTTGEVFKIVQQDSPFQPSYTPMFAGCQVNSVGESSVPLAGLFSFTAASPNPFSLSTSFGVVLARPSRLTLGVYDAGGRLVRSLVSGMPASGVSTLSWDGSDARGMATPSGIYFLRAEVEGRTLTQRLCRVR